MTEWHYVTPEKTHQAFSEEQIPSLVANGTIRWATLIWNGAMTDWKPAGEVKPEWFEMFSTIPDQTAQPTTFQIDVANVPPPFQSPAAMNQTDPIAMGSLVCGIMAIALVLAGCAFPCLGFFGLAVAIPAVVTGHMALGNIKRGTAPAEGRGLAIAGLIMGYATLALLVVGILLAALGIGIAALTGSGIPNQQ